MLIVFVMLNLFWSGAAWVYDLDKLITIPLYLWPLIAVCPIYPLLLALLLLQLYLKKTPNQFLLAFSVIPSIVFGVLAVLFYPLAMFYQGFSWNALGQIFWVWFYAAQGVWLFTNYRISKVAFLGTSTFLIIVLIFQLVSDSYNYLDFSRIPLIAMLGLIVIAIFSIFFLYMRRRID